MAEESERRRRWRRLAKGLLGPEVFKPKKPPTELKTLLKKIFVGGFLWIAGVVLLGETLGDSPVVSIFAIVGWLFLFGLMIRYFQLFFKKGE